MTTSVGSRVGPKFLVLRRLRLTGRQKDAQYPSSPSALPRPQPIRLASSSATNSRAHQKVKVMTDNEESVVCAGCDNVPASPRPRPARNRRQSQKCVPAQSLLRVRSAPAELPSRDKAVRRSLEPHGSRDLSILSSSVQWAPGRTLQSGTCLSRRIRSVAKNASSQSQGGAQVRRFQRRSFASPAARVLRSVHSRWQTGLRSARALADRPLNDR